MPILVVTEPFNGHIKGEQIADPATVAKYLNSDWQSHFVKVTGPEVLVINAARPAAPPSQ